MTEPTSPAAPHVGRALVRRPVVREVAVLVALALSVVAGLLLEPTREVTLRATALAALPLLVLPWRRAAPVLVLVLVLVVATPARVAFGPNGPGDLLVLAALYAVASRRSGRWVAAAVAADLLALAAAMNWSGVEPGLAAGELFGQAVLDGATVLLGGYLAARRRHVAAVEDRAARVARTAELEARAAVEDERRRIARELHDVVAHHVSVMTLHAGALERQLRRGEVTPAALTAATTVRTTGQEAMVELRRLLGLLSADGTDDDRAPQPTLDDLDALAERVRATGLAVRLTRRGPTGRVSAAGAMTVFRIVQEALTNTLRHAGPGPVEVTVDVGEDAVRVGVRDHGGRASPPAYRPGVPTPGRGLAGMRERAALFGGRVDAGPHPDGGFLVEVELPLAPATWSPASGSPSPAPPVRPTGG